MPFKLGQPRFLKHVGDVEVAMPFKLGKMNFLIPWVDSPILNEGRLITYKAGN